MLTPGLSEDARRSVTAAFDAMSAWRNEMMLANERGGDRAFEKMASAAKTLGWPAQIVDSMRQQMQGVTKMQMQMMDQMMDAWEEQVKSPNPMGAFPKAMMDKLQSLPGMGAFPGMGGMGFPQMPGMPGMEAFQGMMTNPMQFWMAMGEQWQKNWAQAMQMWANNAGGFGPGGQRKP
jgi:hypothetical protein